MTSAEMPGPANDSLNEVLRIFARNRTGAGGGIYSVCSTHPMVLEAAMRQSKVDNSPLLIEATANQVNQFGGYTGMVPGDFPAYVRRLAEGVGYPQDRIVLGGDHLGPVCWTNDDADSAMEKACDLVAAFVRAGFSKIHLDASMSCVGDPVPLDDELVAERAAVMCETAENAAKSVGLNTRPVYVIGTEVPVPGGETGGLDHLRVTTADRASTTIAVHRQVFAQRGLEDVWNRVVALVVQPGVEFNHTEVFDYDASKAEKLSEAVLKQPRLVYEAHSTDYQAGSAYRQLVRDHFAILKVGPQLTFALREALFALAAIEDQLVESEIRSNLVQVLEKVMLEEPSHWVKHYPEVEPEGRVFRRFSYSDRIRYYWPNPQVETACQRLFSNLTVRTVPLPLISQFLPQAYERVRSGMLDPSPRELVLNHIMDVVRIYSEACQYRE